jgi:hypothetical protein
MSDHPSRSTIDDLAEDVLPSAGCTPPDAAIPSPAMLGVWQGVAGGTGSKTVRDGGRLPPIAPGRTAVGSDGPPRPRAMSLIGATPATVKVGNVEATPTLRGNARQDDARLANRRADQIHAAQTHEAPVHVTQIHESKQVHLEFVGVFVDPHEHRWADNRRCGARFHHGFCCVRVRVIGLRRYGARFFDRYVHSRMPLVPTPARLKLLHVCNQCHSSRGFVPLTGWHRKLRPNTEGP